MDVPPIPLSSPLSSTTPPVSGQGSRSPRQTQQQQQQLQPNSGDAFGATRSPHLRETKPLITIGSRSHAQSQTSSRENGTDSPSSAPIVGVPHHPLPHHHSTAPTLHSNNNNGIGGPHNSNGMSQGDITLDEENLEGLEQEFETLKLQKERLFEQMAWITGRMQSVEALIQRQRLKRVNVTAARVNTNDVGDGGKLQFKVVKLHGKLGVSSNTRVRMHRVWQVNVLTRKILNMGKDKVKREFSIDTIFRMEKLYADPRRLRLLFELGKDKLSHVYDLRFETAKDRERFYGLVSLLRSNAKCSVGSSRFGGGQLPTGLPPLPGLTDNQTESVSVFCGTWNLGSAPPPENLSDWVVPNVFDVYAFGVQESNYSSGGSAATESSPAVAAELAKVDVIERIKRTFNNRYQVLSVVTLWEIKLLIIVKMELLPKITNLEVGKKATGLFNKLGNKGGVGVSFRINDTPLCFINCHLAAGPDKFADRIENVRDIFRDVSLGEGGDFCVGSSYLFWIGDLNYRINLSYDTGTQLANDRNVDALLQQDQLVGLMSANKVFSDFKEHKVQFPPTYRYRRGCRKYTTEKLRTPSYCDRILVWSNTQCEAPTFSFYNDVDRITTSDHSPVHAAINISTRLYVVPKSFISLILPSPIEDLPAQISFNFLSLVEVSGESELRRAEQIHLELLSSVHEGPLRTAALYNNTTSVLPSSFVWKQSDIPAIQPFVSARELLATRHIQVVVLARKNKDASCDPIGYGVVPLKEGLDTPFEFRLVVYYASTRIATLKGSVCVRFGAAALSPQAQITPLAVPTHSLSTAIAQAQMQQVVWNSTNTNSPSNSSNGIGAGAGAGAGAGWTSLHSAAAVGDTSEVERLLMLGVDPAAETTEGSIALHYYGGAANVENIDASTLRVLDSLTNRGELINHANYRGETVLHYLARSHDRPLLLQYFLKTGADPNLPDKRNHTALHYSVLQKHKNVTRVLLEHNADIYAPSNLGTPIEIARRLGGELASIFDEYV